MNTSRQSPVASRQLKGLIFVVSGPSGSGKTTLAKKLLSDKTLKNKLVRSISFTTRPKRSGERDKKDYFFISQARFKQELKAQNLLEWTKYLGRYYATPRDCLEGQINRGRNIILCLDLKGALQLKQLYPENTITIFVMPPARGVLLHRITQRCHKTRPEEVRQRLNLAQKELKAAKRYDYCVVNEEIKEATRELKEIILKKIKERLKCHTCL